MTSSNHRDAGNRKGSPAAVQLSIWSERRGGPAVRERVTRAMGPSTILSQRLSRTRTPPPAEPNSPT
jgi:hypothetical protein